MKEKRICASTLEPETEVSGASQAHAPSSPSCSFCLTRSLPPTMPV